MYQRGKIQEESMLYEMQKSSGELPIVGVNTFIGADGSPIQRAQAVMRSSDEEKQQQITNLRNVQEHYATASGPALARLRQVAVKGDNTFAALMDAAKVCSLGQISRALYDVGGQYRRNM
jgi:methylmalonyl-CoA mutase